MSKRAADTSEEDLPLAKRVRSPSSPLRDPRAWDILEYFLTSKTTSFEDTLKKIDDYLGGAYVAAEWSEATTALFSGDDDDALSLQNFRNVRAKYLDLPLSSISHQANSSFVELDTGEEEEEEEEEEEIVNEQVAGSQRYRSRISNRYLSNNPFLDLEADDEDDQEDYEVDERAVSRHPVPAHVTNLPGPTHSLASTVDELANRFQRAGPSSLRARNSPPHLPIRPRMYLFHVYRSLTQFIAQNLENNGLHVIVSPWAPGQLYVVSDSPKTIYASMPHSHQISVIKWSRIPEEERASLESSQCTLPSPAWVRVKIGKYKDTVAYVFDEEQIDGFITTLVVPRDFPYPKPKGTVELVDKSRLLLDGSVSDIIREGEVVGWTFKGQYYYSGLLKKTFRRSSVVEVAIPHPDDIRFYRQSGWDPAFVRRTEIAFSKQFLRTGDSVRIISGPVGSQIGTIISTDHAFGGSVHLEFEIDGSRRVVEARLEDVERVFWVGDQVRVVAGVHLGLQGHVIEKSDEIFHICQQLTQEQVQVSKFYLDRRPLDVTLHGPLHPHQYVEPPPEADGIEIGDHIEVQIGEHKGKCGVVDWFPSGTAMLWVRMDQAIIADDFASGLGPEIIKVPASIVQRTRIPPTVKFTKERGYDVTPGDVVSVARGPQYLLKGVVESVDFPTAQLVFRSDADLSTVKVPIRFVMKVQNASVDSLASYIGTEVYIIGGEKKGYRATLYNLQGSNCTVAVHGQQRTSLKTCDVATRYGMRLNGAILEYHEMISFCEIRRKSFVTPPPRSITPPPERIAPSRVDTEPLGSSSSAGWTSWSDVQVTDDRASNDSPISELAPSMPNPWAVDNTDVEDVVAAAALKLSEIPGPISWLKEFSATFFTYQALFKVSPRFQGGRLNKRLVYTESPDPFISPEGQAPKGAVATRCTAKTAGSAIQHYFIPAEDLNPATPRKKGQECIVLDGMYRGCILTVSKCNTKTGTVDLKLMVDADITVTLRFDQVCLVERHQD